MRVKNSYKLMNHEVAAALRFLVHLDPTKNNMETTAWFLNKVCHWHDLVTSRSRALSLSLFNKEKNQSALLFLKEFQKIIVSLRIGKKRKVIPSQKGISLTIESFMKLSKIENY